MLPPDSHVHSEWSYDAPKGSMELTCARAVAIGLPAITVTFGSDAHEPDILAHRFKDAAALAEACGFRPGADLSDPWVRA
jgi:histidinol phosphatase-like PHP family hydrolase